MPNITGDKIKITIAIFSVIIAFSELAPAPEPKYRKSNNPSRKKQPIKRIDSIKNVSKNKRKFIFKLFWSSITANGPRIGDGRDF